MAGSHSQAQRECDDQRVNFPIVVRNVPTGELRNEKCRQDCVHGANEDSQGIDDGYHRAMLPHAPSCNDQLSHFAMVRTCGLVATPLESGKNDIETVPDAAGLLIDEEVDLVFCTRRPLSTPGFTSPAARCRSVRWAAFVPNGQGRD